jgi:hypothetical protein
MFYKLSGLRGYLSGWKLDLLEYLLLSAVICGNAKDFTFF